MTEASSRRPIAARGSLAAGWLARRLAVAGATPNGISVAGMFFAAAGGAALLAPGWGWKVLAALLIQMRLMCNLLDGMVAVEHGRASRDGAFFNEFPDRFEDSVLLVCAGYGAGFPEAGLFAALLAGLTAWMRALGASFGQVQDFGGPMAKQHRMALLTVACLAWAALPGSSGALAVGAALWVAAAGGLVTCVARGVRIRARMLAGDGS